MQSPDHSLLIYQAKRGNVIAQTKLFGEIRQSIDFKRIMKQSNGRLWMNKELIQQDIDSAFWFGIARGLKKVKHKHPYAFKFIIHQGEYFIKQTVTELRRKHHFRLCDNCHKTYPVIKNNHRYKKCKRCKLPLREQSFTILEDFSEDWKWAEPITSSPRDEATFNIWIEEFRLKLSPKELKVFDFIKAGQTNHAAIAKQLNKTREWVGQLVARIQVKLNKYMKKSHMQTLPLTRKLFSPI